MIEVRLLGQRRVSEADGTEIFSTSAQPKRLGLLVFMTLAGAARDGYVSRDEILAAFWPESDLERARNTLNQHLFHLRSSLGSDTVLSRGAGQLGVNFDRLRCDAIEFLAAIEAADSSRALKIYGGDLLPGFYLSGAPGFERWLDAQRHSYRRRALDAALNLAVAERQASDLNKAEALFRRATEIAPESETAWHGLIDAIAAGGDRSGALLEYRRFEEWLQNELGSPPSDEMRALADSLHARSSRPRTDGNVQIREKQRTEAAVDVGKSSRSRPGPALRAFPAVAGIAILALASTFFVRQQATQLDHSGAFSRIAVLPLENLGGDTPDHLVAAIHDDLIRQLQHVGGLTVLSRRSMLEYRNTELALSEIARQRGVRAILAGSVFGTDSLIRIGVTLYTVESEAKHLWGEEYVAAAQDLLNLDLQVVTDIAEQIQVALSQAEKVRFERDRSVSPEAFAAYSLGVYLQNRFNPADVERAIEAMEEAIRLEPSNALYHAGLARTLLIAGSPHGSPTPSEAWPRGKEAALRAVQLDEQLADGHAALGWFLHWLDQDLAGAERAFRRAIELSPSSALAHSGLGVLLSRKLRLEEALAAHRRADELDPASPIYGGDVAVVLYFMRRFDEAIAAAERSVASDRDFAPSLWILGEVYLASGRNDEAMAAHERAVAENPAFKAFLIHTYVKSGRRAEAEQLLSEVRMEMPYDYTLGMAHAALGHTDSALVRLGRAVEAGDPFAYTIKYMPHFDSLRATARFSEFVASIDSVAGAG